MLTIYSVHYIQYNYTIVITTKLIVHGIVFHTVRTVASDEHPLQILLEPRSASEAGWP